VCLVGIHVYFGIQVLARKVIFVDLALAQIAALGATVAFMLGHPRRASRPTATRSASRCWRRCCWPSRGRGRRVPQEALIGVIYVVAAAASILLIDRAPQGAEHLKQILTGNILTSGLNEVAVIVPLYAAIGLLHWLLRRQRPTGAGSLFFGPIAIRWYALAYIGGIVLGWLYARALIKNEKLWGGPAPITLPQMDDFILWVTLGIILGGRTGYVLFYNPAGMRSPISPAFCRSSSQHPAGDLQLWKGGMSFHGGFLGCVAAVMLFAGSRGIPILSLGDITTAVGPIGLFLGRLANFINSELWGRPDAERALGDGVSQWRAAAAPSEPALRGGARRARAVRAMLALMIRMRRAEAAGPDPRQLSRSATRWRASSANSSASPTRSSDFCGAG
jgi:phosphatidylglycerol:prolipoprotein diacylglycerol transferase